MNETANIVIIGGGVVGLAIAADLSLRHEDVFLLEAQPRAGMGTSTRNSGVIHAGLYYPEGSLKARHCVEGARLLYEFCARHDIPHRRAGKLVVARTIEGLPALERLKDLGDRNGAEGLALVDRQRIREIEPEIVGEAALHSPNTGILEPEELIRVLARKTREQGGSLLTGTPVIGVDRREGTLFIRTPREEVGARLVINAAGLYSDEVAAMLGRRREQIHPCRGEYAETIPQRSNLVRGLVYPVPDPRSHGLGIHFTRTIGGRLLLGPNARHIARRDDYEYDRAPLDEFYEDAVTMLPALRREDLRLSYSGIRPKLHPADDPSFADFVIERDPETEDVIHLIGIESPGLTSCLSIARQVSDIVANHS